MLSLLFWRDAIGYSHWERFGGAIDRVKEIEGRSIGDGKDKTARLGLMKYPYSILIQWSDEDQKYIASLPEFGPYARTHGSTYAEAVEMAEEVLELLIESYQESDRVLPVPRSLELYAA